MAYIVNTYAIYKFLLNRDNFALNATMGREMHFLLSDKKSE
jgi:hypothetical protein